MFKKILCFIFVLWVCFSAVTVSADGGVRATVEPYGEFYVFDRDRDDVAQILGITAAELDNIQDMYLAVNKENSKQIRIRTEITDFSYSIGNISNLSNDKITELIPDIIGLENVKGEIINKDGQKFIKIQLRSTDSGGDYLLTQYFTVASRQNFVLSFYTNIGEDTEYIEKTFESFTSSSFNSSVTESKREVISCVLLAAAVVFLLICIVVVISIVADIKRKKKSDIEI